MQQWSMRIESQIVRGYAMLALRSKKVKNKLYASSIINTHRLARTTIAALVSW